MSDTPKRGRGRPRTLPPDAVVVTPRLAAEEGRRLDAAHRSAALTQQQFMRRAILHAVRLVESGVVPEFLLADI